MDFSKFVNCSIPITAIFSSPFFCSFADIESCVKAAVRSTFAQPGPRDTTTGEIWQKFWHCKWAAPFYRILACHWIFSYQTCNHLRHGTIFQSMEILSFYRVWRSAGSSASKVFLKLHRNKLHPQMQKAQKLSTAHSYLKEIRVFNLQSSIGNSITQCVCVSHRHALEKKRKTSADLCDAV